MGSSLVHLYTIHIDDKGEDRIAKEIVERVLF